MNMPTVMRKQARVSAAGTTKDFPEDAMAKYMTKYAEQIFEPKRILSKDDWLNKNREPDQYFESYRQGHGNIKWLAPTANKIFLLAPDDSFSAEQLN